MFISIFIMFWRAFAMEGDTEWIRSLTKKGFVVGMLLMSISKEKEEDFSGGFFLAVFRKF